MRLSSKLMLGGAVMAAVGAAITFGAWKVGGIVVMMAALFIMAGGRLMHISERGMR